MGLNECVSGEASCWVSGPQNVIKCPAYKEEVGMGDGGNE